MVFGDAMSAISVTTSLLITALLLNGVFPLHCAMRLKATLGNPSGSVEKLFSNLESNLESKESVKGAHNVLGGSVRAPKRFSKHKTNGP